MKVLQHQLTAACQTSLWAGREVREDSPFQIELRTQPRRPLPFQIRPSATMCDFLERCSRTRSVAENQYRQALLHLERGSLIGICAPDFSTVCCARSNRIPSHRRQPLNQRNRGLQLRGPAPTQTLGRSSSTPGLSLGFCSEGFAGVHARRVAGQADGAKRPHRAGRGGGGR